MSSLNYKFMISNTNVKLTSALLGRIIAKTLWLLEQVIYIQYKYKQER